MIRSLLNKNSWRRLSLLGLIGCMMASMLFCGCAKSKAKKLVIGDPAPAFVLSDLHGSPVSMANMIGKPILLRFWSTDCKYCRADTPVFIDYFNRFKDQGLNVVYVNTISDLDSVRQFVDDLEIPFPVAMDDKGTVAGMYQVKIVPQTIIISPEHKILAAILGGVGEAELHKLLGPYLD